MPATIHSPWRPASRSARRFCDGGSQRHIVQRKAAVWSARERSLLLLKLGMRGFSP
jgi:hypothetical protein